MRIAFLQRFWEELTGPLILAEIVERQGHEVRFFLEETGWLNKIDSYAPQILAFSVCTGDQDWAATVARTVKNRAASPPVVVFGGAHPTFFPEVINKPAVDAICRGEGESAFLEFVCQMEKSGYADHIENFWIKKPDGKIQQNPLGRLIRNLDSVPIPSRKHLYSYYPLLRNSPFKKMMVSRGCPYNCYYCFNHAYHKMVKGKGPFIRRRSVSNVIEEATLLKKRYGFNYLDFNDDIFILDKNWFLDFAAQYKTSVNMPYGCNIHVKSLDREIASALKDSGCRIVKFGLESANETFRREFLNKTTTNEEIVHCASILKKYGIRFQTYNMLGLPGEGLKDSLDTVHLNQKIRPYYAWCSLAQPYPGTIFAEKCQARGLIENSAPGEKVSLSWFDKTVLPLADKKEIINLQKFFAFMVKYPVSEPLVRFLIKLPGNRFFRIFYQAVYGVHMKRISLSSWQHAISIYLKVRKQY